MALLGDVNRIPKTIYEFEWRIPDFASLSGEGYYSSPSFSVAGTTWEFAILPNGSSISAGYVSLFIGRLNPVQPMRTEVFLGFKTLNGGKKYCEYKFKQPVFKDSQVEAYGSYKFLSGAELLRNESMLLPSKVLTVLCTLKFSKSEEPTETETTNCCHCKELVDGKCLEKLFKCPECSVIVSLKDWYGHQFQLPKDQPSTSAASAVLSENKLQQDLKEFFLRKEDCDVVIKVQGQEFPAHKFILQARSPVFQSTFRNDMKEKETGIMNIEDCDPSSFLDFLCFLYCGEIEIISLENVFSLLTTADKYDVKDLRACCINFIKDNLSIDSFCDTMILALRYSESDLIKLATDFFIKNAPKIIVTAKWQTFVAENPTQSNELFVKLLVAHD